MSAGAPHVVLVSGLVFESRLVADSLHVIKCCGQGSLLASQLRETIEGDCRGILSFGIAAGLDPGLRAGAIVVASGVLADGRAFSADRPWSEVLRHLCAPAVDGALYGQDEPVMTPAEKARIYRETGAVVLDMESHLVARIAAERGVPFAVVRAVSDDAEHAVPPIAMEGLRPDGSTDAACVAQALLRSPSSLLSLVPVAVGTWQARRALARAGRCLGPGLGLLDIG